MGYIQNIGNRKILNASYYMLENFLFWSEVFLSCRVIKTKGVKTCAVNVTEKGMNFRYNEDYIGKTDDEGLEQGQVNFVMLHEVYHLISNHAARAKYKGYDHKLANLAADMIINSDIKERYCDKGYYKKVVAPMDAEEVEELVQAQIAQGVPEEEIEIPFNGYYIPKEYNGPKIVEPLYEWIQENRPDLQEKADEMDGNGTFDEHMEDTVSEDVRDEIIKELKERCENRGLMSSDLSDLINRLRPPAVNYLKMIKTAIESLGNSQKKFTWKRPGRRHEFSRGYKRLKRAFNVILDVSGSMHGSFEKALSTIFKSGYEVNLYQIDTEVKANFKIKTKNQLQKMRIKGCGGTTLQPAIDRIVEESNGLTTIVLTDGYTDSLDFSAHRKGVLILSTDEKCPISGGSTKVKQIIIKD